MSRQKGSGNSKQRGGRGGGGSGSETKSLAFLDGVGLWEGLGFVAAGAAVVGIFFGDWTWFFLALSPAIAVTAWRGLVNLCSGK